MRDIVVGPFVLESPIGRGAAGEVWRARHRERGVTAAVKLLRREQADPRKTKWFFNEVRAVARLNHPGIAWVFDYGTVGAEAAAQSRGTLAEGSPYLVMEHASAGTLADLQGSFSWSEIRAILLALLDALGHAHAHGVIHRDLKPANVLLCSRKDVRPGLKLCDFGIAFALDEADTREDVSGTLHYMAPEQLAGKERLQGPWTDLYAFGCLTWRLLTGRPPFHGRRQMQLALAHTSVPPPAFETETPLPEGFQGWLRQLLAKQPRDRFACAADASAALVELGHPEGWTGDGPLRPGIEQPILQTPVELESEVLRTNLTHDWRRPAPPRPSLELVGAGLALFGLREPTFTGREAERDRIWDELVAVTRDARARSLIIEGPAGIGKSRLAEWMAMRAAEVGAGSVLSARFSGDDADGALREMLLRRFTAQGLGDEALQEHLARALDHLEIANDDLRAQALAFLAGRQLQGASRYVVIRLLLESLARERPVVLILDDIQNGLDGARFVRHVHNAQAIRPFPILMLLCARSGDLAESPVGSELVALEEEQGVSRLALEPLPREPFVELVQDLLGLEPELARVVVDRTAGNPQFAIQVVGDWVRRDQLRLGSRGFKLKQGVRPQLPPDLKYVWIKRLAHALKGAPPAVEPVLEAAAVLGMDVDGREWAGMLDDPEGVQRNRFEPSPTNQTIRSILVDRLVELNLARETDRGFAFLHGEFRNAILDRARAHKRLRAHHRAAACQIDTRRDTELERYGRHLLAAREREAALDPLLRAVPAVQASVGRMSAWRLLDTVEHAMRRLDLPSSDARWGRLWTERSSLAFHLGRAATATRFAAKAGREASRHGWKAIAAQANFLLARDAMRSGDDDMAQARLIRVTNQVDPDEHPFLVGEALFLLGTIAHRNGEPRDEVVRLMKSGRSWMLKDTDPRRRVRALLHLAKAALESGSPSSCAALIERARGVANDLGDLPQQVHCLAFAAEVARQAGQLDEAAARLKRAVDVFELIGDAQLALLRCNLAIVHLEQGDLSSALQELDRALANALEVDRLPLKLAVHTVRVRGFAVARRYAQLDEALREVDGLMGQVALAETDSARSLEQAYDVLREQGQLERAERARVCAVDQYTKLRDEAALKRLGG